MVFPDFGREILENPPVRPMFTMKRRSLGIWPLLVDRASGEELPSDLHEGPQLGRSPVNMATSTSAVHFTFAWRHPGHLLRASLISQWTANGVDHPAKRLKGPSLSHTRHQGIQGPSVAPMDVDVPGIQASQNWNPAKLRICILRSKIMTKQKQRIHRTS